LGPAQLHYIPYILATSWMIESSSPDMGLEFFSSPPWPDRLCPPAQPLTQRLPGVLFLRVKRPGREADKSPPSSAEVGAIPPLPHTPSWLGTQLKHRDNFTFTNPVIYNKLQNVILLNVAVDSNM
jgi:hypothetical protein